MTDKERNDLFYVCALIEYTARKTKNHRGDVVRKLGRKGIERQLKDAQVNHSLSFEQVCDEIVEQYRLTEGSFDTVSDCKYDVPSYTDIGKLYAIIIENCMEDEDKAKMIESVYSSYISDEISKFDTDLYYQNPDYIKESFLAGRLLD